MKILITGGTGFVGRYLIKALLDKGHSVTSISRHPRKGDFGPSLQFVMANTIKEGPWQDLVPKHDAIVNLAGVTIFGWWTLAYKQQMWLSRVITTRNIVDAIPQGSGITLINASGTGYYGFRGDEFIDESFTFSNDFLALVAAEWEAETVPAVEKGSRVVITRFGVVLGEGGALEKMVLPFKLFVGGPLATGKQWVSWIHMDDLIRALVFCLEKESISGPVNCCAPDPVTNEELSQAIGKVLHRPSWLRAPEWALRLLLGEFANVLVEGHRVYPRVLEAEGFTFNYPTIDRALEDLLRK